MKSFDLALHGSRLGLLIFACVLSSFVGCRDAPPGPANRPVDPVWSTRFLREIAAGPGRATVMFARLASRERPSPTGQRAASRWVTLEPARADELLVLLADKASFTPIGELHRPCVGAQIAVQIQRDDEPLIFDFECGLLFWEDGTFVAGTSPALHRLLDRLAADVLPCVWQRLEPFDAEVCAPAWASVVHIGAFFDVSIPNGACPHIWVSAPDASNREFVQTAGSLKVACVHGGEPACDDLCDTIRLIPRPTRAEPSSTAESVLSYRASGGNVGGPMLYIGVWSDGSVELTSYRCAPATASPREIKQSSYTVRTMMSAGALTTLLSRLKQKGILEIQGAGGEALDAAVESLNVRIGDVTRHIGMSGGARSQAFDDALSLIIERVGVPDCE